MYYHININILKDEQQAQLLEVCINAFRSCRVNYRFFNITFSKYHNFGL